MAVNKDISFDREKFKQVLHYIISKVGTRDNVGKTVLYKMLYFSDFDYYELRNKSITGENYFKLPNGPAPSHFEKNVEELKKKEKIKEIKGKYGGYPQIKFDTLHYMATEEELEEIDYELVFYRNPTFSVSENAPVC